jgi:two-component system, OmpR family, sensor histidine kinase KdpD
MSTYFRPDPDDLLAHVQAEEARRSHGRLKIFLGYAAGVGKTYAMLEAAHQRQAEGVDVVVGYVETHSRAETEALLAGLELIPRRQVAYNGATLPELDVDALLARQPQLALIDELAHTNAPGSRHSKRYLDVAELVNAGIDVYTTLNIQHLESLNDVVAQITGVTVRETVPDRVLDEAAELQFIDLPPDELQQRLAEGKVYVPEQAARAIEKFFRKGNLTALREMALRRTAERVDGQMRAYMQTRAIPGPWSASERLLVAVSPSPLSERLVRATRRLADELNAEWFAVYAETPAHAGLTQEQRDKVAYHLRLAAELGAKTAVLPGRAIAETLVAYARTHNVTKIVAGKPLYARWRELLRGSIVDQLIRQSGQIDVYVISNSIDLEKTAVAQPRQRRLSWSRYLLSLLLVTLATALGQLVYPALSVTNILVIYLFMVIGAAVTLGRGPATLTSLLGVLAFDFFFVPPYGTFAVSDTEYILTFLGLFAVGMIISYLTDRFRQQVETALQRASEMSTLYELSRDLAVAADLKTVLAVVVDNIGRTFSREAIILLPDAAGQLDSAGVLDENETAVAAWVLAHGQPAGRGTETLTAARSRYLPLKTAHGIVGVMSISPPPTGSLSSPEQRRLLEAFASLSALAVERARLDEEAQHARLLAETERLRSSLLSSVSHDLRTPLAGIMGAATTLLGDTTLPGPARQDMTRTIYEEAYRLNSLVNNLLNMTRLESGAVTVHKAWQPLEEVVGAALIRLETALRDRPVQINMPSDLPLVPLDEVLIEQVLVNLLENALKYTPTHSPIEISATATGAAPAQTVTLSIADRGPGLPTGDEERVFDKFYRGQQVTGSSVGLGLSICRGMVAAHKGRIWAENRPGGGVVFRFTLPVEGFPPSFAPEIS